MLDSPLVRLLKLYLGIGAAVGLIYLFLRLRESGGGFEPFGEAALAGLLWPAFLVKLLLELLA